MAQTPKPVRRERKRNAVYLGREYNRPTDKQQIRLDRRFSNTTLSKLIQAGHRCRRAKAFNDPKRFAWTAEDSHEMGYL